MVFRSIAPCFALRWRVVQESVNWVLLKREMV